MSTVPKTLVERLRRRLLDIPEYNEAFTNVELDNKVYEDGLTDAIDDWNSAVNLTSYTFTTLPAAYYSTLLDLGVFRAITSLLTKIARNDLPYVEGGDVTVDELRKFNALKLIANDARSTALAMLKNIKTRENINSRPLIGGVSIT